MIEQLEQIRNLSAATDNSITSDQKIEARENNKKNSKEWKIYLVFWKFGKSGSYFPQMKKICDKISQ